MTDLEKQSLQDYKIAELAKAQDKVVEVMNDVVKKNNEMYLNQELANQRIKIYTVLVGIVFNTALVLGIHFSGLDKEKSYSEDEKIQYYNSRAEESETVKALKAEIVRLKGQQNGSR